MNVPVIIEVNGLLGLISFQLALDVQSLDQAAAWCGSYDILEMGRHFDAYVINPRMILLPQVKGFPTGRRYARLPGKWPAPSVHGNIGEAVAALTAVSILGFEIAGLAHIKPGQGGSRDRLPDLLLRVSQAFERLVLDMCGLQKIQFPEWIPCEAKCRKRGSNVSSAFKEAKGQLKAFWGRLTQSERGFGIACCFVHRPPQEIHVRIFLPDKVTRKVPNKGITGSLFPLFFADE